MPTHRRCHPAAAPRWRLPMSGRAAGLCCRRCCCQRGCVGAPRQSPQAKPRWRARCRQGRGRLRPPPPLRVPHRPRWRPLPSPWLQPWRRLRLPPAEPPGPGRGQLQRRQRQLQAALTLPAVAGRAAVLLAELQSRQELLLQLRLVLSALAAATAQRVVTRTVPPTRQSGRPPACAHTRPDVGPHRLERPSRGRRQQQPPAGLPGSRQQGPGAAGADRCQGPRCRPHAPQQGALALQGR